jgi:mitochondrial fission protein ELM1
MFETKYLDSMQKISDPSKAVLSVSDLIISTDDNMEFIINATAAEKPIIAIDSELNRESRSKESKDFISRLFNYNIDYLNLENLGDFDNIIEHQSPAIPYDNIKENAQSIALEYCLHKARDDYIRTLTNDANTNAKEEY